MSTTKLWLLGSTIAVAVMLACDAAAPDDMTTAPEEEEEATAEQALGFEMDSTFHDAASMLMEGKKTFRFDTFGDEEFWGGTLRLHDAIKGSANGGVGPGVSPEVALSVGLKVDVTALPKSVVRAIRRGTADLSSPQTTLALLRANAVVGLKGFFDSSSNLTSIGIQCALCHSTVDDSLVPGIGHRLDGWANRDLNVGAIINLSPDLSAVASLLGLPESAVRSVLASWGPGKFDASLFLDGKNAPTLIPPAFGLAGVNLHTFTGWGSVPYWNALVATLEMHGKGTLYDPRLDDSTQFPVAARTNAGNTRSSPDLVTPKLAALHFYQLALKAPRPPRGSFNARAAERGRDVFEGAGRCATCHVPPLFTEPGWNLHTAAEIGIDDFQANRSPERRYRTTPLRGLTSHAKGGFYHDGRFGTLEDVVAHYDTTFGLALSAKQKADLVEYLKSL